MAGPIFDIMWRHMRERTLTFEGNQDLTCVLCKNLLVDACKGSCDCKYCYKCISDYNIDGDKHCPGNEEYCNDNYLVFGRDIMRNEILNKKVSKVKINCPNSSCECNMELMQLDDHLRVCTKQRTECPYTTFGCVSEKGDKDSITTHLHSDTFVHTRLLLELIENMKNELSGLKEDFEKNKLEDIERRNKELEESRIERENLITMIEVLRQDMSGNIEKSDLEIATLKEESTKKDNKILELERKLKGDKDGMLTEESSNRESNKDGQGQQDGDPKIVTEKLSASHLKQVTEEIEVKIKREREEIHKYINEQTMKHENARKKRENAMMKDLNKNIYEQMSKRTNCADKVLFRWTKLCSNIDVDFVWRIDQCSKKKDEYEYSDSFYSNNYKLCLCLCIDDDGDIGFWCYLMKGDNDDKVRWPMNRSVDLAIIDQCTLRTHKMYTYKYDSYEYKSAFERPKKDRNDVGIGSKSFVKYSSIKDQISVIADDSMIVSCVFTDP